MITWAKLALAVVDFFRRLAWAIEWSRAEELGRLKQKERQDKADAEAKKRANAARAGADRDEPVDGVYPDDGFRRD